MNDQVKTIVIRLDKENDIVIHSTLDKAPYTLFCVFLSIGYTPQKARQYVEKTLYNLNHKIKYEHVYEPPKAQDEDL